MHPVFAVIGRVNEGKSSVVATLVEDDQIKIGNEPGTTRKSTRYDVRYFNKSLYTIVDTPGFEEPERMLAWLKDNGIGASERPRAVQAFYKTFSHETQNSDSFRAECELLRPILDGACVLYVVNASHPFRPSFEDEMEILRWTGRPRMALINHTSPQDYSDQWMPVLHQYFNVVKSFNAQKSRFEDRIALLESLKILDDTLTEPITQSIAALNDQRHGQQEDVVQTIAKGLIDLTSLRVFEDFNSPRPSHKIELELCERYYQSCRNIEKSMREEIERIFGYERLAREEQELATPVFQKDLFARESWEFLGQSRSSLAIIGAIAGGTIGGAIDLKAVGATHFLGAPIGAAVGALSALTTALSTDERKILGVRISGKTLSVGPHTDPNFPWVVIDRAILHLHMVMKRTHAVRDKMIISKDESKGVVKDMDQKDAVALGRLFLKVKKASRPEKYHEKLSEYIRSICFGKEFKRRNHEDLS